MSVKNFSPEFSKFSLYASLNHKNNRWLVHDPDDVPVVPGIKLPVSVCILAVV
jgi:hypothetical protein